MKTKTIKVEVPVVVVEKMKRLLATGLYGRSLEECAFRLLGQGMHDHLARGGLLHEDPDA